MRAQIDCLIIGGSYNFAYASLLVIACGLHYHLVVLRSFFSSVVFVLSVLSHKYFVVKLTLEIYLIRLLNGFAHNFI